MANRKIFNVIPGDGEACILLYGEIGGCDRVQAADVVAELMSLQARYSKIDVRINSYGGEVYEGIAICSALKASTADINIYIDGIAASIASVIALCGKPLHMSRYARLMLHQVTGGAYGTAEDMREAAVQAEEAQRTLAQIISAKCKMTEDEVTQKFFSGGEHWIPADEALRMGLIDSIYDTAGQAPEVAATPDEIYRFTNRLTKPQKENNMAFIDELRRRPAFSNSMSEADMLAHIDKLANDAAKVPALEREVEELTQSQRETRQAAHEALINQAISEGRITSAQKEVYQNLLQSDEENARKLLDSLPKKTVRVVDTLGGAGGADLMKMSWEEIDKAERLPELKKNFPELYDKKFKEYFNKK